MTPPNIPCYVPNEPKKRKRDQALHELVAEYEQSSRQGLRVFLGEEAFQQLLDYYEEEEQLEKAIEVSDLAISQHAYSADFYLRKAYLLLRVKREDLVKPNPKETDPDDPNAGAVV